MPETIATRTTWDGRTITVEDDGNLYLGHRTPTRHRPLDVPTALLVAGEAALFDAAELPSLIEAAHRLRRKTGRNVLPGALRALASRLSAKAGTRPADLPPLDARRAPRIEG